MSRNSIGIITVRNNKMKCIFVVIAERQVGQVRNILGIKKTHSFKPECFCTLHTSGKSVSVAERSELCALPISVFLCVKIINLFRACWILIAGGQNIVGCIATSLIFPKLFSKLQCKME